MHSLIFLANATQTPVMQSIALLSIGAASVVFCEDDDIWKGK